MGLVIQRLIVAAIAGYAIFISGIVHAASINFADAGIVGSSNVTSLDTTYATINNANDVHPSPGFLVFPPGGADIFSTNNRGAVCATLGGICGASMEILFKQDVENVSIGFSGYDQGDQIWVSSYLNNSIKNTSIITNQATLDLSAFGVIDRLFFNNPTTTTGLVFHDIEFDLVGETIIATPLPAALPMFGAALGLIGLLRLRRQKR